MIASISSNFCSAFIYQLRNKIWNCGDSILAKFNNYRSYGSQNIVFLDISFCQFEHHFWHVFWMFSSPRVCECSILSWKVLSNLSRTNEHVPGRPWIVGAVRIVVETVDARRYAHTAKQPCRRATLSWIRWWAGCAEPEASGPSRSTCNESVEKSDESSRREDKRAHIHPEGC